MDFVQRGILPSVPPHARYLEFTTIPGVEALEIRAGLEQIVVDADVVVGLSCGLVRFLGGQLDGHRAFPAQCGPGIDIPSTQGALWIWVRGAERGEILHRAKQLEKDLSTCFDRSRVLDGFKFGDGRDLTGYEDGTENPDGQDAIDAAFDLSATSDAPGGSFVAVQQWIHSLDNFASLPTSERDNIIGRRQSDNEELEDAPESAHVKRTAQEDFDPEAFILRRSMPWADAAGEGLNFVAFGKSFDAFEAQLQRMTGQEDGIVDGLFRFSRPVTGGYYWCPPVKGAHLDLSCCRSAAG